VGLLHDAEGNRFTPCHTSKNSKQEFCHSDWQSAWKFLDVSSRDYRLLLRPATHRVLFSSVSFASWMHCGIRPRRHPGLRYESTDGNPNLSIFCRAEIALPLGEIQLFLAFTHVPCDPTRRLAQHGRPKANRCASEWQFPPSLHEDLSCLWSSMQEAAFWVFGPTDTSCPVPNRSSDHGYSGQRDNCL